MIQQARLPPKLLKEMERLAERAYPLETGGAIMGYTTGVNQAEVIATAIVGPGGRAKQMRTSFEPDYEYQEAEISRIYFASDRRHTYLGDWHTHPDSAAKLSKKDKAALRCVAAHEDARAPQPIMSILGYGNPWELCIWRLIPGRFAGIKHMRYVSLEIIIA